MNTKTETQNTFADFGFSPEIQKTLAAGGFVKPTEIQNQAIPLLMSKERIDFHGQAQTGTGKTLAFGLPLLHRINVQDKTTQALIIAPTRELAVQICDSLRPLAQSIGVSIEAIYGGVSMEVQLQKLRRGVHIVVGTPGRVIDHLRRRSLSFDNIKTLVLDEADIMLDMGFKEDIDKILEDLPETREIWLFSATVKGGIYDILKSHMRDTKSVRANKETVSQNTTKHYFCVAPMHNRFAALCRFIESNADFYGFIFCQTKILTAQVAEQLMQRGYRVGALHGDLSQGQRNMIIKKFKAKDTTILVATDVAARGIDVANLTHVINYSFPEDQESYIHRSGRTGRAGRDGIAITFVSKGELRYVKGMQTKFNVTIEPINVPDRAAIVAIRAQEGAAHLAKLAERAAADTTERAMCPELVKDLSDAACRAALSCMLYDKFIKSVDDNEQFGATPALSESSSYGSYEHGGEQSASSEFSLNVGSDDGVQREDVTAILENKGMKIEHIVKIRVLKRCTFIHVVPDQLAAGIAALNNTIIGGTKVRAVRVSAEQSQRGGGYRPRGGDSRGGGYHRRGGERSDRGGRGFDRGGERNDRHGHGRDRGEGGYSSRKPQPHSYRPDANRRSRTGSTGYQEYQ